MNTDISETAEIIQFAAIRPKLGKNRACAAFEPVSDRPRTAAGYYLKEDVSDTCRNQRLRSDRRAVWREADAIMGYWHAAMKMDTAVSHVQKRKTRSTSFFRKTSRILRAA